MQEEIVIKGAKENNLKNIDVRIPRNTLTVFTGLSGSGIVFFLPLPCVNFLQFVYLYTLQS